MEIPDKPDLALVELKEIQDELAKRYEKGILILFRDGPKYNSQEVLSFGR